LQVPEPPVNLQMKNFRTLLFFLSSFVIHMAELIVFQRLILYLWGTTQSFNLHLLLAFTLIIPFAIYGTVTTVPFALTISIAPKRSIRLNMNALISGILLALVLVLANIFLFQGDQPLFLQSTCSVYMILLSLKSYETAKVGILDDLRQ
jgi:hypothetical protein